MSVSPDIHSIPNLKTQMTPTVDSEREEFRKYLEASGVLDVMTRVFKELYEQKEKPTDVLNFVIKSLGAVNYESVEIVALKDEIQGLKVIVENLENENLILRGKLDEVSSS